MNMITDDLADLDQVIMALTTNHKLKGCQWLAGIQEGAGILVYGKSTAMHALLMAAR